MRSGLIYTVVAGVSSILPDLGYALAGSNKPFLRRVRSVVAPFTLPWYENGLKFECTGCGKCCKVDGDVWLAPEEVESIMAHLGFGNDDASLDAFRNEYVRAEVSPPDGDRSQSWMCLKRKEGACVFLNPVGQCSIYEVRPVQCSTYPFWPSVLRNRESWEDESVLPDDVVIEEGSSYRHWSPDLGGCEGIRVEKSTDAKQLGDDEIRSETPLDEGPTVDRQEIASKLRAARKHWKRFPVQEIKESTWYL